MSKVILITGASAGIGHRACEKLLNRDHVVYAAARRVDKMSTLIDMGAHVLQMDVTDIDSVNRGISELIDDQGRVDVLVNNAGYGSYGTIEDIPVEEIQNQFDVNVLGCARLQRAVLPYMRAVRSGRIINVASVVSFVSTPVLGWYAATKHAIKGMSDALRMEVASLGIQVVLIEPGALKTEFDKVAFAALDNVDVSGDYKEIVANFVRYSKNMYAKCGGPDSTAKIIVKAIEARRPRSQYRTTIDAKALIATKAVMCDRIFDYAVGKAMK